MIECTMLTFERSQGGGEAEGVQEGDGNTKQREIFAQIYGSGKGKIEVPLEARLPYSSASCLHSSDPKLVAMLEPGVVKMGRA